MSDITIPGDLIYLVLIPLIAGAFMVVYTAFRDKRKDFAKEAITEFNVATVISRDLTEVKSDVKELRKEQSELSSSINNIKFLTDRVDRVEGVLEEHDKRHWPRFEDALRQISEIRIRVYNLEDKVSGDKRRGSMWTGGEDNK